MNMAKHEKIFSDLTWHLSSFSPSKASKTWLITLKDMTDPDLVLDADKNLNGFGLHFQKNLECWGNFQHL